MISNEKLFLYANRVAKQMTNYFWEMINPDDVTTLNPSFLRKEHWSKIQPVYSCRHNSLRTHGRENLTPDTCYLAEEDQLMIFLIKVCDYIEDVFTFIAKYHITSADKHFDLYKGHNPVRDILFIHSLFVICFIVISIEEFSSSSSSSLVTTIKSQIISH